jgi:hypothetical protein
MMISYRPSLTDDDVWSQNWGSDFICQNTLKFLFGSQVSFRILLFRAGARLASANRSSFWTEAQLLFYRVRNWSWCKQCTECWKSQHCRKRCESINGVSVICTASSRSWFGNWSCINWVNCQLLYEKQYIKVKILLFNMTEMVPMTRTRPDIKLVTTFHVVVFLRKSFLLTNASACSFYSYRAWGLTVKLRK